MASQTPSMGFYLPDVTDEWVEFAKGVKENFQKLDGGTGGSSGSSGGGGSSGGDPGGGGTAGGGIMPVGSIYLSVVSTNPSYFFGGTWQAINNCFLVGQGSMFGAGTTGGASTHHHEIPLGFDAAALYAYGKTNGDRSPYWGSRKVDNAWGLVWGKEWDIQQTPVRVAYTSEVSNLPPYLAVYMWKRTG